MQIYTGTCGGDKLNYIKKYKMGIMISPSAVPPRKEFAKFPCALDNGAFQLYKKGYPFIENAFMETLETCYSCGIKLDFIVCPDVVEGGEDSLDFSIKWARTKLKTAPRLALVVQDGMKPKMIDAYVLSLFSMLFVGGSVAWKWKTANRWVKFAHENKKKIHIGQVGRERYLNFCEHIKVDSVDSTNFARNDAWSVIERFQKKRAVSLLTER